jgi:type II secretory pathway component PulJ
MLVTLGSVAVLASIITSQQLDAELTERDIALKAAVGQMERVLSYSNDLDNLQVVFSDPSRNQFEVEDLRIAGRGSGQGTIQVTQLAPGELTVDIVVQWVGVRGARRVSAPMYLTETIP